MRNVIASMLVSLDGYFSGPNPDLDWQIDWHVVNDEFGRSTADLLDGVDTMLFGRVTYEGLAAYWTSPSAIETDPIIAGKMNATPKIVFSKTLDKVEWGHWNNARLVKDDLAAEVSKLKQQPGKDMVIFGSGSIISALAPLGLIDEYRIFVVPKALGDGKALFKGIDKPVDLKLLEVKTFKTGVLALRYGSNKK